MYILHTLYDMNVAHHRYVWPPSANTRTQHPWPHMTTAYETDFYGTEVYGTDVNGTDVVGPISLYHLVHYMQIHT